MLLSPAPSPYFTALDSNGDAVSGALVYSLNSGGTWPGSALATYSDAAGLVANTNPIVCDAAGRCVMWWLPTVYKLIICDAAGVVVRTVDGLAANSTYDANVDIAGIVGEDIAALDVVYLSDGTGGRTAGRWYKTDADLTYTSSTAGMMGVVPSAIASGVSGAIRMQGRVDGYVGLTPGARYYVSATAGGITATAPTNRRLVGMAALSTALVVQPTYVEALGVPWTVVSVTTDTTADALNGAYQLAVCAVTGTKTLTLYTAVGHPGWALNVKLLSGTAIVIEGHAAETIDGAANVSLVVPNSGVTLVSDGANWHIV